MAPNAGPWLSPKVVTVNSLPNVLPDMGVNSSRKRRRMGVEFSGAQANTPWPPRSNSSQIKGTSGKAASTWRSELPTSTISQPLKLGARGPRAEYAARYQDRRCPRPALGLAHGEIRRASWLSRAHPHRAGWKRSGQSAAFQAVEHVRFHGAHAVADIVAGNILPCHGQGILADIRQGHFAGRQHQRRGDANAAGAGA